MTEKLKKCPFCGGGAQIREYNEYNPNDKDTLDMITFRAQGISYREIAEMYGMNDSAVYHRIKYYKDHKKNRTTAMVAAI